MDFDIIVALALDNNIRKLKDFLKSTSVDILQNGITPAELLAFEKQTEAVKCLLRLGANVQFAIRGAARGGHYLYAKKLSHDFTEHVNWLAQGAAMNKDKIFAEHLRQDYAADVNWIAKGAAMVGDEDYAEYLRIHHQASVDHILEGAAIRGDTTYIERLRSISKLKSSQIAAIAALGGQRAYAETLRTTSQAKATQIAAFAAMGGDIEYAETLRIDFKADPKVIADQASRGGQMRYYLFLMNLIHSPDSPPAKYSQPKPVERPRVKKRKDHNGQLPRPSSDPKQENKADAIMQTPKKQRSVDEIIQIAEHNHDDRDAKCTIAPIIFNQDPLPCLSESSKTESNLAPPLFVRSPSLLRYTQNAHAFLQRKKEAAQPLAVVEIPLNEYYDPSFLFEY